MQWLRIKKETNVVLSMKSTYPVGFFFLLYLICHLLALQEDWKRFRRVSVSVLLAMVRSTKLKKSSLVSHFLHRIKVEICTFPLSVIPTQLQLHHVCYKGFLWRQLASETLKATRQYRHGHIGLSHTTLGIQSDPGTIVWLAAEGHKFLLRAKRELEKVRLPSVISAANARKKSLSVNCVSHTRGKNCC